MIKSNGLPASKQLAVRLGASPRTNISVPFAITTKPLKLPTRPPAPKLVYIKPGR